MTLNRPIRDFAFGAALHCPIRGLSSVLWVVTARPTRSCMRPYLVRYVERHSSATRGPNPPASSVRASAGTWEPGSTGTDMSRLRATSRLKHTGTLWLTLAGICWSTGASWPPTSAATLWPMSMSTTSTVTSRTTRSVTCGYSPTENTRFCTGERRVSIRPPRSRSGSSLVGATVTAYCNEGPAGCRICCGPNPTGLTAAGTRPSSITVAGPRSVPLGTWVEIRIPGREPLRKRVEDRTAKRFDGRWDLFFPDHASAKRFGIVTNATVRILK